ncbi:hypothetical protein PLICRDRAFT_175696 [Plicaturopsis crispa FD-325 SS-3]|nr:hypothetical protein PLICRDRAFT_175696 [Plicaturopsis crispa FD-325 SS-3]
MSRNNVRGPSSALTEFLREQGISHTTIARRVETRAQNDNAPVAGPSNAGQEDAEEDDDEGADEDAPGPSRRTRKRNRASGYASDDLDEPEEEEKPAPKKRKLSKAAQAKATAKEKENAKKKAKKGKKDEDDDYDEDEDAYTALSKSTRVNTGKPPVGNFETCAECEKQFTVTKYTIAATPGPGFLCHNCAKSSGTDPFKKPALPRKRKNPNEKRTVVNFEEKRFPSLASLCIQIITRHIDDVEALGDIGAVNLDEIAKAIARNRSLTTENAQLFYDVQNERLTLYDCTKITAPGLCTLASLNPNLVSLRLDFCGLMDDTVTTSWCTALPSLRRLELLGPFLVRVPGWVAFFEAHPKLEGFLITQSPRFNMECVQALVKNCKGLTELRLKEVGAMEDGFITEIKKLKTSMRLLDLSDPTNSCSEDMLIDLMRAFGPHLTHLDLSGHTLLTDAFLDEGLKPHTRSLASLTLRNVPMLTDEGVGAFFDTWCGAATARKKANPSLTTLDFSRNPELGSLALTAIMKHSGASLTRLNINGWKGPSEAALREIPTLGKMLQSLDVGWCREMDDFIMKDLMEKCPHLVEVKVWGCNHLTQNCPKKRGVSIYGVEAQNVL